MLLGALTHERVEARTAVVHEQDKEACDMVIHDYWHSGKGVEHLA